MEKKLKINVPDGYEIDKEKSTFETIVFKKKDDDVIIKWNKNYNGVEICADGEHFIVDSNPSYCMNWDDAMRFYNQLHKYYIWGLPNVKQLQVLAKHINKVNEVIRDNNGFEIFGWMWSYEEDSRFCAWGVFMNNGYIDHNPKYLGLYVRTVLDL